MSKTPLVDRLRIKSGHRVSIVSAPERYREILGPLPKNVNVTDVVSETADIVLAFFTRRTDLEAEIETLKGAMGAVRILWISYPKGGPNEDTDLNRDILWAALKAFGLRPVAQIAIDEVWSALRFKKVSELAPAAVRLCHPSVVVQFGHDASRDASQSSSTFTRSDISQSLGVTPAAIAGVTRKVWWMRTKL